MKRPDAIEAADPKGLIRESYVIDGIQPSECRTIFLDWALSVPADQDTEVLVKRLLGHHGQIEPAHPMTDVLKAALSEAPKPKRRGGFRARRES